jgi:hypothetical protein
MAYLKMPLGGTEGEVMALGVPVLLPLAPKLNLDPRAGEVLESPRPDPK